MTWAALASLVALELASFFVLVAAASHLRDSSLRAALEDPRVRELAMTWVRATRGPKELAGMDDDALAAHLMDFMAQADGLGPGPFRVLSLRVQRTVPADHIDLRLFFRKGGPRGRR